MERLVTGGVLRIEVTLRFLEQGINIDARERVKYICIADIARYKNAERTDDLIGNWLRNSKNTGFLAIWEQLNSPVSKLIEFDGF